MAQCSAPVPRVICRTPNGLQVFGAQQANSYALDQTSAQCSCMSFSTDGRLLAWCNARRVEVFAVEDGHTVFSYTRNKTALAAAVTLSPLGTLVASYTNASVSDKENLRIWDVATGRLVKKMSHPKSASWEPKWSANESVCLCILDLELHFYENNNFGSPKLSRQQMRVLNFSVATTPDGLCMVATHEQGQREQGKPDYVRILRYPQVHGVNAALATASFPSGSGCTLLWNCLGTALLALLPWTADGDQKSISQRLRLLTTDSQCLTSPDSSCLVELDKPGELHDVAWAPSGKEFCVVYGSQPANASLFGQSGEKLYDIQKERCSHAYFSPRGNILCLTTLEWGAAAFTFWDLKSKQTTCFLEGQDATGFEWCPDGERFLITVTSLRLKVNNKYSVYTTTSHSAKLLDKSVNFGDQLLEATWCPTSPDTHPLK